MCFETYSFSSSGGSSYDLRLVGQLRPFLEQRDLITVTCLDYCHSLHGAAFGDGTNAVASQEI